MVYVLVGEGDVSVKQPDTYVHEYCNLHDPEDDPSGADRNDRERCNKLQNYFLFKRECLHGVISLYLIKQPLYW